MILFRRFFVTLKTLYHLTVEEKYVCLPSAKLMNNVASSGNAKMMNLARTIEKNNK